MGRHGGRAPKPQAGADESGSPAPLRPDEYDGEIPLYVDAPQAPTRTWWDAVDQAWPLVEAEIEARYGVDLGVVAHTRSLRWLRVRLYGLPPDGVTAGWLRARNEDDTKKAEELDDVDDVEAFIR